MAESPLRVELDRDDPTYRPGERIAGRVVVEPDEEVSYRRVVVERKVRTRGKGDTDTARAREVVVEEAETVVAPGERREYAFEVAAPDDGPATYRGEWIALEWIVEARLDVRLRRDPSARAVFTLEPDEALRAARSAAGSSPDPEPGALRWTPVADLPAEVRDALDRYPDAAWLPPKIEGMPDREMSEGAKKATGLVFKVVAGCVAMPVALILLAGLIVGTIRLAQGEWVDAFGAYGFVALFVAIPYSTLNAFSRGALGRWVKRRFARRRLGQVNLKLEKETQGRGEDLVWFLRFEPRRALQVNALRASLVLEEWVTYSSRRPGRSGSAAVQTKHTVREIPVALDEPRRIGRGEDVVVPGRFRLPVDGPPSFHTFHNQLRWGLKVEVDVERWPDYTRTAPLDVA